MGRTVSLHARCPSSRSGEGEGPAVSAEYGPLAATRWRHFAETAGAVFHGIGTYVAPHK